jgi:hypothetical protein
LVALVLKLGCDPAALRNLRTRIVRPPFARGLAAP